MGKKIDKKPAKQSKKITTAEDDDTWEAMLKSVRSMLKIHFAEEPYLQPLPNDSDDVGHAIATLMLGGCNVFFGFENALKKGHITTAAISLRAIIEVNANIKFILENKNPTKVAKDYSKTAEHTIELFYAIKTGKVVKPLYWAGSISSRVGKTKHFPLWKFLCSYAHVDAGHISAYTAGYYKNLPLTLGGMFAIQFYEIFNLLSKHRITKTTKSQDWAEVLLEQIENDKKKNNK